ncbi:hypothetical protein SPH9361_04606 [Sphingobium sp. CECT 9361]|nr:hypothetical protein SPH9361_04606 [Sphingobium sp. CECT 9361]
MPPVRTPLSGCLTTDALGTYETVQALHHDQGCLADLDDYKNQLNQ